MELKIEYVDPKELKVYVNNAKIHTEEQVEQIKESIREFGFNDPIAVWKENEIIEGHGRLIAALELNMESVPVIRLDDLSDEQRRAYMLVHNKLTMNTDFDLDILKEELDAINMYNMGDFGFDLSGIEIEDIDTEVLNPKEPIARELGEANNYIVLEFMTEEEWTRAQMVFGLEKCQTSDANENIRRHGIGRVISGLEILEALEGSNTNEN